MKNRYLLAEKYKLGKSDFKLYLWLVIASLVYVLPIILADRYYNDDLARSLYGATGWNGDGRPLGESLIVLLCGGKPIVDISPLPLILAILFLSYSLIIYARNNLSELTCDPIIVCISLFIIANPLAMSNLSYKNDCAIMLVALSIPFLVFSVSNGESKWIIFAYSFMAGIMIMSLYQTAIGMCIVLFLINIYFYIVYKNNNIINDFDKIAGVGCGSVIYTSVIAPRFIEKTGWRNEASHLVPGLSMESIEVIVNNIKNIGNYIRTYFMSLSFGNQVILCVTILMAWISAFIIYNRECNLEKNKKVIGSICIVIMPICVLGAPCLPLIVLNSLRVRSRLFLSFGGFLFFIGIMMLKLAKKKKKLVIVLLVITLFFQYSCMYAYGNALKSQKEYEKYMITNIAHDLETINGNGEYEKVSFIGNAPKARQVQMMCEKYPFFEEIVPVYINNDTWIGGAWVYHYLQYDLVIEEKNESDCEAVNMSKPIIQNSIYSCYLNGKKIIVNFN